MRKWDIGFGAFWLVIVLCGLVFLQPGPDSDKVIAAMIWVVFSLPVLMHGMLSYGCYKRSETSRKISVIVFALWLPVFPIGTFLAMYLCLPATQWKNPEADSVKLTK